MLGEITEGYCTLCRSRCGSLNHVVDGRLVEVIPNPNHPTGAALCAKGRAAPELVGSPRRLTRPLKRTRPRDDPDPGWVEISWDEALTAVAGQLGTLRARYGAETVAFAVTTPSGTPMVDSFEWVERFIRVYGSPNLIYAVEVCGWHKDYAHALTFGRGTGAPDYASADVIILWGHNPARTWLAQATRIAEARRRGATVVVVDPKRGGSGEAADLWLPIRPGADGALAMGAINHHLRARTFNEDFVRRWTNAPFLVDCATGRFLRATEIWPEGAGDAFVVLRADGTPRAHDPRQALAADDAVRLDQATTLLDTTGKERRCATVLHLLAHAAAPYDHDRVALTTGLDHGAIEQFYALFAGEPRLAYHSWTGVGQHTNATMTERAIATLYALTGAVDRAGGNIWTVAPPTRSVNDYALLARAQQEKALGLEDLPLGPPSRGWITARDFRRAVIQGEPYRVRALVSFGTNFAVSQGDTVGNLEALRALDLHVHVDMFMNPTAENADILLPANMPWEREALKIGFEITQEAVELIQLRQPIVPPHERCRADYEIVFDLACRLGHAREFFDGSVEAGWDHMLEPVGLTVAELRRHPGGVRVPQPCSERKYAMTGKDGDVAGFATPTRRVELYSELLLTHGQAPLPCHVEPFGTAAAEENGMPLLLSTAKSGWYVHSSLRHVASLRRKAPEPTVDLSHQAAASRGIADGDVVMVRTAHGEVRMRARLDVDLPEQTVIAEFGWWEDCPPLGLGASPVVGLGSSNINTILHDGVRDSVSGSVPLRAVPCEVVHDAAANRGRWSGRREFRVVAVRRESAHVVAVTVVPADRGALPNFRPGQHVLVHAGPAGIKRAYSLTGSGDQPTHFSIAVKLLGPAKDGGTPGRMSSHVHAIALGDAVALEMPSGTFTPPLGGARPVALIAAGIGITPFVSYLETLATRPAAAHPSDIHLLYVCRDGAEHVFGDRLRALEGLIPGLSVTRVFTRPAATDVPERDYDRAGRSALRDAILILASQRPLAYLCGVGSFIADAIAMLAASGVPRFDIFSESFASAVEMPSELKPREVRLARSNRSFTWTPTAGSLLDAADEAELVLPSGCRAGQCESCSVRITSGSVAHLAAYDGPSDTCLTCRAVPLSDLVIDA